MRSVGLPESGGASRWPAWFGFAGLIMGFGAAFLASALLAAVPGGYTEGEGLSPAAALAASVVQDVALVAGAVWLAARVARPTPGQFGLRPVTLGRAAAGLFAALVVFYGLSGLYSVVLEPQGEQDVLETLGAGRGGAYLVASALMVMVLAPVAEEVFFRGFLYRGLRNRFSVAGASAVIALIFGSIHYSGPDTLALLPVLALLGVIFCLLYEWTGSLYPVIALHAINNAAAFAVSDQGGAALGAAVGVVVVAACAVAGIRRRPVISPG